MTNRDNHQSAGGPSRKNVWQMFDRIAGRYDLLNRLLSMRQDVRWRRKLAEYLPDGRNLRILDIATGTADVLLSLLHQSDKIARAIGVDMAREMLKIGREKIHKQKPEHPVLLFPADAMNLPFEEQTFDGVTIAFGIRNVLNLQQGMGEMRRVIKPGGRLLILEFSLPANRIFRRLYLFYFRKLLPLLGGFISGDMYAYNYLNRTVETFPYGDEFCRLMKDSGFKNVKFMPLTKGIAAIYSGDR